MTPDLPIQKREPVVIGNSSTDLGPKREPTIADLIVAVLESGLTQENFSTVKDLFAFQAQREFSEAFIALQAELPQIAGTRGVPDRSGAIKFKYANFEDIDEIVRPICLKHGFSYSFRETAIEQNRVTITMTLQHRGGHYREVPCSVRIGSGPPGATESQADMSGHAYAKRGALEAGLSLRIVGARQDARIEGAPITKEQAEELAHRVNMTNSNREAFLKFAGAKDFFSISSSRYDQLDSFLKKKEKAQ